LQRHPFGLRAEHKPEVYERSSGARNPKDTVESRKKLQKNVEEFKKLMGLIFEQL